MTTYLGKSCSFCLPRVPFVHCCQFMYLVISPFGFEGRIWDLIVSVPDHCLSFYWASAQPDQSLCYEDSEDSVQTGRMLGAPLLCWFCHVKWSLHSR